MSVSTPAKSLLRKLLALFLLAIILSGMALFVGYRWLHTPMAVPADGLVYTLSKGGSLSSLASDLEQQGVLSYGRLLTLYARLTGQVDVKAGEYRIEPADSPARLLHKLRSGEVISYLATLVEGWTFREALSYLQSQPKIAVQLADDEALDAFIAELELPGDHPEGWFFPDSYRYVAGNSDREILLHAHRRMRDVLATEWANRHPAVPYDSSYEALIMASIVERETGVAWERGQIAGVFVRRLASNMRLQTDPTVIYGLADNYDGNLRRRHLSQATPYNTYVIKGLPPTPIALPGQEAIHAALHPEEGEALYFVAKGDGSHHFSATLEEHNRAVQRYQVRERAQNYQSAPSRAEQVEQ